MNLLNDPDIPLTPEFCALARRSAQACAVLARTKAERARWARVAEEWEARYKTARASQFGELFGMGDLKLGAVQGQYPPRRSVS